MKLTVQSLHLQLFDQMISLLIISSGYNLKVRYDLIFVKSAFNEPTVFWL